jgi:hypothetical protein
VEEMWKRFKEMVFESIRFVPHKILRNILDPEYYNKEEKRLKVQKSTQQETSGKEKTT